MLTSLNPINPGDIPITPSQEGHLTGGKDAFASELTEALNRKNKPLGKEGQEALKANLLNSLGNTAGLNFKIHDSELQAVAGALDLSVNETSNILSTLKNNLMGGIKSSLLRLEDAVLDPDNKVPAELQQQFMGAINQIKADFSTGFGVLFEDAPTETHEKEAEDILSLLFKNHEKLPPAFAARLDQLGA